MASGRAARIQRCVLSAEVLGRRVEGLGPGCRVKASVGLCRSTILGF